MFRTVLLATVTLMNVYVFWRASSVPLIKRILSLRASVMAGAALWLVFFIGRYYGHGGSEASALLQFAGMTWMGVLFLMTVSLLFVEAATGFGLFFRRHAPSLRGAALLAGALLSAISLLNAARPPVVRGY